MIDLAALTAAGYAWTLGHSHEAALGLSITALIIAVGLYLREKIRGRHLRGKPMKMSKKKQKALERTVVADLITKAFQDAEYRGKLSRDAMNLWYRTIGTNCNLPDLLPKKILHYPNQHDVKEDIKARRANGINKPSNLPDPTPRRKPTSKMDGLLNRRIYA